MERKRGFEIAKGFEGKGINLPLRNTKFAAGYDFEAAEDTIIKPGFEKPTLVKTGIKAYMMDDEVLKLYNRSSNPKKKKIILANSVGIVDKDYYGNEEITINKGDRIGQGVFQKYLVIDNEEEILNERNGGFGSTGK